MTRYLFPLVVLLAACGGSSAPPTRLEYYLSADPPSLDPAGLILILVFAVRLRWFPPSGSGGLAFLLLPALTLGMRSVAFLSRRTQAAMQEVPRSDFIRTARAKELGSAGWSWDTASATPCSR